MSLLIYFFGGLDPLFGHVHTEFLNQKLGTHSIVFSLVK